jgi:hypothetical protein
MMVTNKHTLCKSPSQVFDCLTVGSSLLVRSWASIHRWYYAIVVCSGLMSTTFDLTDGCHATVRMYSTIQNDYATWIRLPPSHGEEAIALV